MYLGNKSHTHHRLSQYRAFQVRDSRPCLSGFPFFSLVFMIPFLDATSHSGRTLSSPPHALLLLPGATAATVRGPRT